MPLSDAPLPTPATPRLRTATTPARVLAQHAVEGLLSKKAKDLRVIDLRGLAAPAEFFVLATGESELQLRAMMDAVRSEILDEAAEKPWHVEGTDFMQWVVLDYVDLVVHLFLPERRAYYGLERLWGDAPFEDVPEDSSGDAVALLHADAPRPADRTTQAAPDDVLGEEPAAETPEDASDADPSGDAPPTP